MNEVHSITKEVAEGIVINIETGLLAKQANGSVTVRSGDTIVFSAATMSKEARSDIDFMPLVVDFDEKMYAAGKFPGGFFKREGRPSERAILYSRIIDRSIRPLFPKGLRNDVCISSFPLSIDNDFPVDVLSIIASSAALCISDIPFDGPVGAVRVGEIDKKFILNPTIDQIEKSDIDIVIVGKEDNILMIEGSFNEIPEDKIIEIINYALPAITKICDIQKELISLVKPTKSLVYLQEPTEDITSSLDSILTDNITDKFPLKTKQDFENLEKELKDEILSVLSDRFGSEFVEANILLINQAFQNKLKKIIRNYVIKNKKRVDGRSLDEIRPISIQVGLLPRAHGSALFTRGQTQALSIATLGTQEDSQIIDTLYQSSNEIRKRYMHHYNFPGFSVGEARPSRGPGRREIGHGALAEKALLPVLPKESDFPYTIRVVSEILESNGSSSMASACGSSLSLMDAGVPISKHVGGIAMGLIYENEEIIILSDITGLEDAIGDMDFKVTGTIDGVSALQLDVKVPGIPIDALSKAIKKAYEGRKSIIEKMNQAISHPREMLSNYAPRIEMIQINPEKISDVIGQGGKIIKKIIEETGSKISIEQDGKIYIASTSKEGLNKTIEIIQNITKPIVPGQVYIGKVTKIFNFGALVEISPGKEGLVHISELSKTRVKNVEDVLKLGDEVTVKVLDLESNGKINLSIKALSENPSDLKNDRHSGKQKRTNR
ncbi:Polyribonucleotide nucleotidyltransferase [Thermodesulfobium narugense DSM 14796]|uniref:Polyribonucleotide nucleotidyltransferase n=1 Tax=Thermodesulfobium narugense DSM 14796 TaxID=747365 RepID=M1E5E6_9BACT|nr:polyribonucleotide nucleotidyltransferase [Thermodesulfobium narugense]AEE14221.1 Polyribonucleotide nucleotidyltransferase [Thermodesulfobium narugense DSM 14796]